MAVPFQHPMSAVKDLVSSRGKSLKHLFAAPSSDRLIVFESDDWGSRRMPCKNTRDWLISRGLISGNDPYGLETLENAEDIGSLAEVLSSFKDIDGRHPVFTCFCNPGNPDFIRIREFGFDKYVSEPVSATLERRGDRRDVDLAWQNAREARLLVAEYHGREHLQVPMWMRSLRESDLVREAFDHEFYSVPVPGQSSFAKAFRAACFFSHPAEIPELVEILKDGARMFDRQHGYPPRVFCPPNNVFHPCMFPAVREMGCHTIVRPLRSKQPDGRGSGKTVLALSRKPLPDLRISRRNVIFEPVMNAGVEHAMKGIESAFAWGVPAVISTHRVNYIGGIEPALRSRGLRALSELLSKILQTWTDVRFLAGHELAERVSGQETA